MKANTAEGEEAQTTVPLDVVATNSPHALSRPDPAGEVDDLARGHHALRTALTAILGFSEIIERELLGPIGSEQYRDYARNIHDTGMHLLSLAD